MTTMTKQSEPFPIYTDQPGVTVTSGYINDAARRAFWQSVDVYEVAAHRVRQGTPLVVYSAREVLDISDD